MLELPPTPSKEIRGIAERALALNRNLRLWGAACHLQGFRSREDESCESEVRAMLRMLYGEAGDTVANLAKALSALGAFDASTKGTPIEALLAAVGQPKRTTRKSLGIELKRLLALPASDQGHAALEACLSKLADDEREFVRLAYGTKGGWAAVQRKWASGRRLTELGQSSRAKLAECLPRLAKFAE